MYPKGQKFVPTVTKAVKSNRKTYNIAKSNRFLFLGLNNFFIFMTVLD